MARVRPNIAKIVVFVAIGASALASCFSLAFGTIKIDLQHFGGGGYKFAYWARVENGNYLGFSDGTKLVVKAMRPEKRKRGYKISDTDIKSQQKAVKLAKLFNSEVKPQKMGEPCNVYMRTGKLDYFKHDHIYPNGSIAFAAKEAYIVELPIYGKFEKFNSNTGWSSGKGTLADTFSHWSWVRTDGDVLVCDLQGHRGDPSGPPYAGKKGYYYCLTDPAISSRNSRYGTTDLGQKGIETWFKWHKCNSFCKRLGIENKRARAPVSPIQRKRGSQHREQEEKENVKKV